MFNGLNWDESKHPRDDDGKFTFKNGETSSNTKERAADDYVSFANLRALRNGNPEDILYRDEKIKREKDKIEAEYKSKLLDILGDRATPADILYGTKEKLEKKIEEYGLQDKLKGMSNNEKSNIGNSDIKKGIDVRDMYERNIQLEKKIPHQIVNSILQLGIESAIGKLGYVTKIHEEVKKLLGLDTAGMLDLAHEKRNEPSYTKDAIELKNFDDPRVASDKKYLAKKLYSQFNNEYTKVTNIENIKGYFFKSNSEPSQRIANNDDFKKTIRQNKSKILNGQLVTMEFPNYGYNQKSNLHYAFGHVDIRNGYIDKEGNLRIKVYDTYDFNKTNPTPANQAGRNQMLKGNLKPFFTIHDIIVPKKDIDELWK